MHDIARFASLTFTLPFRMISRSGTSSLSDGPHEFTPQSPDDLRSPCPALNALANHGYLSHDGREIDMVKVLMAIKEVYGLSFPLAAFITLGGYSLMHEDVPTLYEFARHNRIEHNASLSRADAAPGAEYAPTKADHTLLNQVCDKIETRAALTVPSTIYEDDETASNTSSTPLISCPVLRTLDAGYIRHWRDGQSPPLDNIHALVAQGELAAIIGIFSPHSRSPFPTNWSAMSFAIRVVISSIGINILDRWLDKQIDREERFDNLGDGIPVDLLRTFFGEDKIPEGWKPHRKVGLLETFYRASIIKRICQRLKTGSQRPQASP